MWCTLYPLTTHPTLFIRIICLSTPSIIPFIWIKVLKQVFFRCVGNYNLLSWRENFLQFRNFIWRQKSFFWEFHIKLNNQSSFCEGIPVNRHSFTHNAFNVTVLDNLTCERKKIISICIKKISVFKKTSTYFFFTIPFKQKFSKQHNQYHNHADIWAQLFKTNDVVSYFVKISNFNMSNTPIFFVKKVWEAFAVQKLLSFFQQKISVYSVMKS